MLSDQVFENSFLIVDSYPFGRDTLRRALLSMGADKVDIAVSASNALSMCKNNDYDMVLSDFDLGEGKNGQQLLEELRSTKRLKNVSAFIILTSETAREIVLSTLEYQPDDYLAKPYPQNLLERRVKRLLRFKSSLHEVFQSIDAENLPLAIQDCENYLAENDEFRSNALRILAQLYYDTGQLDKAQAIYEAELSGSDSDWARLGLGRLYVDRHRLNEAESLFLELIDINYMYVEAYEQLAKIYLQLEAYKKAEDILARAVLVSPLSQQRQRTYANLCEKNVHYDAAVSAWRNVIKASRSANNELAENHLNLSRCLTDFCDYRDSFDDEAMTSEAIKQIEIARTRYHNIGDNELQALLIESRIHYGKGKEVPGKECMKQAVDLYDESPSSFSPGTQLEFAKSLSQTGEIEKAENVLASLVATTTDIDVLSRADKILDEPVSEDGKKRIIKLNREGIKHFKEEEYAKAVNFFREAQLSFPKNIELNLNLIQALIKSIKSSDHEMNRENWLTEAEQCLTQIRHISPRHKKYSNYQRLQKELETLQRSLAE